MTILVFCTAVIMKVTRKIHITDDWGLPGVSGANTATGFRQIAASNRLWALTNSGRLACRVGVKRDTPAGLMWVFGIGANFLHTSG